MLKLIADATRRVFPTVRIPPGAVPFEMGGKVYHLQFDYRALDELAKGQGIDDLTKLMIRPERESLQRMLLIGLRRHHADDVTAAQIERESPPIAACIGAISAALNLAYWGPGGPPKDAAPKAAVAAGGEG